MRINQNIMAFNAFRNLSQTNTDLGKSLEKLSSGFRINRAADDAAGLVVSEGLRAQVSGLRVATRNAQDGTSVVQTAEGALTEVHSMLRRMRDLTVQASNTGANDADARAAAQAEIDQLVAEIDRISTDTKFGQVALLDGTYGNQAAQLTGYVSNANITAGEITIAATDAQFDITIDGGAVNADVTVAAGTYDIDEYETALQSALDTELGAGVVTASVSDDDGDGSWAVRLERASTAAGTSIRVDTATTAANDGLTFLTGLADAATDNVDELGGTFQVGANSGEVIRVTVGAMDSTTLLIDSLDVETDDTSRQDALDALDTAIASVSTQRGALGAVQNRFEHTIANLSVTAENLAASESRIRDTDMALELVSFTRHQILQQAGTAMLAQANQVPSSVLSLLQ
jgi:flagellin